MNHSLEYREHASGSGPPTGEWVLTDQADGTQLGKTARVQEKQAMMCSSARGKWLTPYISPHCSIDLCVNIIWDYGMWAPWHVYVPSAHITLTINSIPWTHVSVHYSEVFLYLGGICHWTTIFVTLNCCGEGIVNLLSASDATSFPITEIFPPMNHHHK